MSKHTKGPWELASNRVSPPMVIARGLHDICTMSGAASNESVMADARLIAAAPDLLDALESVLAACKKSSFQAVGLHSDAMDRVRSAIAKAKGEA